MSCYLFANKTLNSSFAEIDAMKLETLLDFIDVYDKVYDVENSKGSVFIDDIL